jgi:hypothetical protein
MMTYRLTSIGSIERISDGAIIPVDTANADYSDFLAWQDAGNEPEDAPASERTIDWAAGERERLRLQAKSLEESGDQLGAMQLRLKALEI